MLLSITIELTIVDEKSIGTISLKMTSRYLSKIKNLPSFDFLAISSPRKQLTVTLNLQ